MFDAVLPFDSLAVTDAPADSIFPVAMDDVSYAAGGKRLLDGLSLRLEAGPTTVIMGANGAGKSLTLRLLQGLIQPSGGRILWGSCADQTMPGRRVALVFQRPVLLRRSVAANLAYALKVYGLPAGERPAAIERLLALAQLTDLRHRPARVLSGGEQQRLSVVRALAAGPGLLLLDEPTAALDPQSTEAIEQLVGAARRRGAKIVLVTHDAGQARRLADEVVFLYRGRVAERTPAAEFFDQPRSEPARAYLAGRLYL